MKKQGKQRQRLRPAQSRAVRENKRCVTVSDNSAQVQLYGWASAAELLDFCDSLFTNHEETENAAVAKCAVWKRRMRNKLPTEFEVTCDLVRANRLFQRFRAQQNGASDLVDEHMVLSVSSLAVVRCTNLISSQRTSSVWLRVGDGDVDDANTSTGERPRKKMRVEAKYVGLPSWIVEVRHAAAHREKPSISLLERATCFLLDWLKTRFWSRLRDGLLECASQTLLKREELAAFAARASHSLDELFQASLTQKSDAVHAPLDSLAEELSSMHEGNERQVALYDALISVSESRIAERPTEKLNLAVLWRPFFQLLLERDELASFVEFLVLSCASRNTNLAVLRELRNGALEFVNKCVSCGALNARETQWRLAAGRILDRIVVSDSPDAPELLRSALVLRTPTLSDSARTDVLETVKLALPAKSETRKDPEESAATVDDSLALAASDDWSLDASWLTQRFVWSDFPLGTCPNHNPVYHFRRLHTSVATAFHESAMQESDSDWQRAESGPVAFEMSSAHDVRSLRRTTVGLEEPELLSFLHDNVRLLA